MLWLERPLDGGTRPYCELTLFRVPISVRVQEMKLYITTLKMNTRKSHSTHPETQVELLSEKEW